MMHAKKRSHTPLGAVASLLARWRRDTRGTSLVTTAITLPMLITIFLAIFYLFGMLSQKLALNNGMIDAAHYISENARYWDIDPQGRSGAPEPLLPADYYDQQARRLIESRLRDTILYSPQMLTDSLKVWVEEPLLAYAPGATEEPIEDGSDGKLCDKAYTPGGSWRAVENIRFRIYAEFKVPLWTVKIPDIPEFDVTLADRAIGYVQCPRWKGKREQGDYDKSKWIAAEGPAFVFRALSTPFAPPTVTEQPLPPTSTLPIPTNTPSPP
jgi:hypothetical protein